MSRPTAIRPLAPRAAALGALLAATLGAACSDGRTGGAAGAADDPGSPGAALATELDLLPKLAPVRGTSGAVHAARHADRGRFGDDWYAIERSGDFAWARGKTARVSLLVAEPERCGALEVELRPADFLERQAVQARLGETDLGRRELVPGWQRVRWELPADLIGVGFQTLVLAADEGGESGEYEASGRARRLAFACGRIALVPAASAPAPDAPLPTPVAEERVGIARIDAPRSLVLAPGESTWAPFAVDARAAQRLRLELEAPGPARVLLRATGRGNGAVLHRQVHELPPAPSGSPRRLAVDVDLTEAAGTRLVLELSALAGSAPVTVPRASVLSRRSYTDVVFLVVDTLRADHTQGSDRARTPNIDAFAAEGISFPRAFAHACMTLPSHTALFSSRLPWETGVVENGVPVGKDLPLLADWLGELGYETRAVVSMGTMWPVAPQGGLDRGFTTFDYRVDPDMSAYWANERVAPVLDELEAVSRAGAPFFLFVHYSDPHRPYHAHGRVEKLATVRLNGEAVDTPSTPDTVLWRRSLVLRPGRNEVVMESEHPFSWQGATARTAEGELDVAIEGTPLRMPTGRMLAVVRNPEDGPVEAEVSLRVQEELERDEYLERYTAEVEHVDGGLGELVADLERRGLFDDSLIVFTSDHGQGLWDHNVPNHGKDLFDEQIHVPLVVKPPAGHPDTERLRARREELARLVDVVPTVLELADLPPLPGQSGLSLLRPGRRVVVAETHYGRSPVIYAVRDERWKLMWAPESDRWALFDVVRDPDEREDRFEADGQAVADWQELLRGIHRAASAPIGTRGELDAEMDEMLEALGYVE